MTLRVTNVVMQSTAYAAAVAPPDNDDAAAAEEENALLTTGGSSIPQKIWQIFFTRPGFLLIQHHVHDWLRQAPDYTGDEYGYSVRFSQWTIAAAPGHPVVADMVERVMAGLQDLVAAHNVTLDQLMTHPANLSGLNEIRYFGDITVLPIEGFMANMQKVASGEDNFGLVTNDFQGAWKGE
ncbi:hypothetical protein DL769_003011 [Monosporascus sp. CRB-8-3]|nr:hypothetical protein DL769_003011 [Monosporascus sp. CRB-8-3]